MRSLGLALLVLALSASPASAAVISVEEHFCGCDPSSGDEDTVTIRFAAEPGERNLVTVRRLPRGVLIKDDGAPLTGACRPANSGSGRFCRVTPDAVDVDLDDGDDTLDADVGGLVQAGLGDDEIHTRGVFSLLSGGPGADLLDARGSGSAEVTYVDHGEGVTVRLNGLADDGAAGEGDNVIGPVTGMTGGNGNDRLEAGSRASILIGGGGDDVLVGSPGRDNIDGEDGDDILSGREGDDYLTGGGGADDLSGGGGTDEANYLAKAESVRLSIGDGANDGAAGENDDIHADIEALAGGSGNDVLTGTAGANRLIAYGGQDVLRGGAGPDKLIGWDDGDELDAGPGPDRVRAGALDRPLLEDGEVDVLNCRKHAPAIEADAADVLRSCGPAVDVVRRSPLSAGRLATLELRCPPDSAVPCQGRVWLHRLNGSRVSRKVRYGPIEPGERTGVRVRLARRIPAGVCLLATAPTRRNDGLRTLTIGTSAIGCLRVPRRPR
jgi:Ca2+-binding RTX toxin-like protein